MLHTPFYDPEKTYEENFKKGPFGAFANGEIVQHSVLNKVSQYDFLGFKVNSPFGIASGPLINGKFVKAALDKGFDIVEYKDTRTHKYPCHPLPNIAPLDMVGDLTLEMAEQGIRLGESFKEPLHITNSFGIPSMDPDFWQADLRDAVQHAREGQIVVGGLQGTLPETGGFEAYLEDFVLIAKLVKETGVKVIELNLACPNEGAEKLLCLDIENSFQVVRAVKEEIGDIPLIIKISYFKDPGHLEQFIKKVGPIVQAISAINTIPAKIVDSEGKPALTGGRVTSGTCGAPIKWAGLDMVRRLKALREKLGFSYAIIGVGGVITADDFFEYRDAGADAVMSATGAMWNPYLAKEIKSRL
jgi:dihydroorotate dehydrogenase (NAD+) catalytic subunit